MTPEKIEVTEEEELFWRDHATMQQAGLLGYTAATKSNVKDAECTKVLLVRLK